MEKKVIYVVLKHSGMIYDNPRTVPLCAFTSDEKAREYADNLNDELAAAYAKCDNNCEDNAVYTIRILTDKYIEENYPEVWDKMNDNADIEDDLFWEEVGDIEYEFEKEHENVIEYAQEKVEEGFIEEKSVEDIINYYAYSDTFESDGVQPFYSVSRGVELFEC